MLKVACWFLLMQFFATNLNAQKRSNVWCFGHNAAIDFNSGMPVPDTSAVVSRGSCANICDKNGNFLFCVANDTDALYAVTIRGGKVYDKNYEIMQDGDSLVGRAWYQEHVIFPNPADSNEYFVFTVGVTSIYGFYYSIVDMTLNGGLGAVAQKNVMLDSFPAVDCIIAIKHGNGRDWWVIFKRSTFQVGTSNNEWHEYLVTPIGITNYNMQQIGVPFFGNAGKLCVTAEGNKIAFTHFDGLVETYDFDRCSGVISNARTIEYPTFPTIHLPCFECAFSPNNNLLYITTSDTDGALIQFNLLDTNPSLTKDTLWYINFPQYSVGAIRRAPDNKLYISTAYYNGFWNYPYPDSVYNMYNMNLSVINYPDSLGAACDFQPYSFYLGGKRTYWGLPNNPDYDLGKLAGSLCDTLQFVGLTPGPYPGGEGSLTASYISAWQKLFVNAHNLKGKNCVLKIFDVNGKEVFSSTKKTQPPYYTLDVDCRSFANGFYLISLITEKEKLSGKFVKE